MVFSGTNSRYLAEKSALALIALWERWTSPILQMVSLQSLMRNLSVARMYSWFNQPSLILTTWWNFCWWLMLLKSIGKKRCSRYPLLRLGTSGQKRQTPCFHRRQAGGRPALCCRYRPSDYDGPSCRPDSRFLQYSGGSFVCISSIPPLYWILETGRLGNRHPGCRRFKTRQHILQIPRCTPGIVQQDTRKANVVATMQIIGDVKDKNVVLVDDIVDTAGTITKAANIMLEAGAKSVRAIASHCVMSDPASFRVQESALTEMVFTDSIPYSKNVTRLNSWALPICSPKPSSGWWTMNQSVHNTLSNRGAVRN